MDSASVDGAASRAALLGAEAAHNVVVDEVARLHERVGDDRPTKLNPQSKPYCWSDTVVARPKKELAWDDSTESPRRPT